MIKRIKGDLMLLLNLNDEIVRIFALPEDKYYVEMKGAAQCVKRKEQDLKEFCDLWLSETSGVLDKHLIGAICLQNEDVYVKVCLLDAVLLFWLGEFDEGNDSAGTVLATLARSFIKCFAKEGREQL